jgi:uncharacterized protein involved in response to NO
MSAPRAKCPVVLQTGFRIFFLGAAAHAVVSMLIWLHFYVAQGNIYVAMPLTVWHGHEMIFGFVMAVVSGFLLTAVINWTGLPTLSGTPLMLLFLSWLAARVLAFMPAAFPLWPMVISNMVFFSFLAVAVARPIIAVKQWRQSAVFSKLGLMLICGGIFYAALAWGDLLVQRKALRFAVYVIISLIFTIGRRVMPFFIERGVGYPVTLRNSKALDIGSLTLLTAFSLLDVFWPRPEVIALLSAALAVVHGTRLAGWYTPGIFKKPLLWILFAGYGFIILGFGLKVFAVLGRNPDDAALHAWTAGGIGVFTLGMMARVSWGHTGRNIAAPPRPVALMFAAIITSAVIRVFFPLLFEEHYVLWVGVSQTFWMLAFVIYLAVYFHVLAFPRPDGNPG